MVLKVLLVNVLQDVGQIAEESGYSTKTTRVLLKSLWHKKLVHKQKLRGHGGPWGYAKV